MEPKSCHYRFKASLSRQAKSARKQSRFPSCRSGRLCIHICAHQWQPAAFGSNPIQSNPFQSNPIHSRPIQSAASSPAEGQQVAPAGHSLALGFCSGCCCCCCGGGLTGLQTRPQIAVVVAVANVSVCRLSRRKRQPLAPEWRPPTLFLACLPRLCSAPSQLEHN